MIATKNNFDTDTASREEDVDASLHSSSSSSRWTKCLIVGVIALVAVVADEENVIATNNDFDTASREEDVDASLHSSSSSSRWTKCLIAGVIALVAVVAVSVALPLVNTREAEDAALQITRV